ncbi:ABC transporter ATP-binding protein/permease [Paenibacillus thiaminolyticus]|uniref:ABC transporter ATP-binding protein n=1 Tax=Paenibacillus thiaminolyticus TaxID=49283 RepID=UPI00232F6EEC|nr:ABC transporter ATP-binding protein [Paenibacillus thiaminolyticus]WCF10602.1 ABC transporter ATP-binding protein/permease [Paenibacillus thiaminolyticus]
MKSQVKWRRVIQTTSKILPLLWKMSPRALIVSHIIMIAQACLPLVQIYLVAKVVGATERVIAGELPYIYAVFWLLGQVALSAFTSVILLVEQLNGRRLNYQAANFFEHLIIDKTLRLSLLEFEKHASYDLLQLTSGSGERGMQMIMTLRQMVMNTITISGYLLTLWYFSPWLSLFLVIVTIPSFLANVKLSGDRFRLTITQSPLMRKASYLQQLFRNRDAIKEIQLFRMGAYFKKKWNDVYWEQAEEKMKLERKSGIVNYVMENIGQLSIAGTTVILVYIASKGRMTIAEYVALTIVVSSAYGLMKGLVNYIVRFGEEGMYAERLFNYLQYPESKQQDAKLEFPKNLTHGVTVRDLSFTYPNRQESSLKNVNLHIKQGERIAIVGDNGAGKSTFIKCLLGIYPVHNGTIFYDKTDICDIRSDSLKESCIAVFQDSVRYQLTVRENLMVGNMDRVTDDKRLHDALKVVGLSNENHSLELDTPLGHLFQDSTDLSGGQWQRMALARVFIRDASFIVFDEPTGALDPLAEEHLFNKMLELTENKTAIFISHRLSSCIKADRVVVFKDGEIHEFGTHIQLLERGGYYAKMFQAQSEKYQMQFAL